MKYNEQIDRIKIKLTLAKVTDEFYYVFGAKSHQYVIHEPVSINQIKAFEEKYEVSLPDEYVAFLTRVENGGISHGNAAAGPMYGIFGLDTYVNELVDTATGYLKNDTIVVPDTTEEEWYKLYKKIKTRTDEEYYNKIAKLYGGILPIGYYGCTDFFGLILNGTYKGRVVNFYDEKEYGVDFEKEDNFLDWYENWLDDILSGKRVIYDKAYVNNDEDDLIAAYFYEEELHHKIRSLYGILCLDKLSEKISLSQETKLSKMI